MSRRGIDPVHHCHTGPDPMNHGNGIRADARSTLGWQLRGASPPSSDIPSGDIIRTNAGLPGNTAPRTDHVPPGTTTVPLAKDMAAGVRHARILCARRRVRRMRAVERHPPVPRRHRHGSTRSPPSHCVPYGRRCTPFTHAAASRRACRRRAVKPGIPVEIHSLASISQDRLQAPHATPP